MFLVSRLLQLIVLVEIALIKTIILLSSAELWKSELRLRTPSKLWERGSQGLPLFGHCYKDTTFN